VPEADSADMDKTYTPEELATFAEQTAREVGAEMIRWWQDENDPHEVHIEATLKDKNISVLLLAILDNDA
jgi:hypothetical protein